MGWDLLGWGIKMHYFRRVKGISYKESLCGIIKAPVSRDIPGMLEASKDMCKTCYRLAPKRRWGHGFIS